jgi:nitric oxide dioxygenase
LSTVDLPDNVMHDLCGPMRFMQAIRSALLERGVAPADIEYEVFGPGTFWADRRRVMASAR